MEITISYNLIYILGGIYMREKFTLIKTLRERSKHLKGKKRLSIIGQGDFPGANNVMRATMNIKHQVQHLTIDHPEFPMVYDGKENIAGKYSSYYDKADKNYEVIDIIKKYDDRLNGKVNIALMFLYCKEDDSYKLIERQNVENLSENFGFEYNTEYFDNCKKGDVIDKGDIILKPPSYTDDGNTAIGVNARTLFAIDPCVEEDAVEVNESFTKRMVVSDVISKSIPINDDTVLLNLYGKDGEYKGLPDIGDYINGGILAATRILRPARMFSDFRDSALNEINIQSDQVFYGEGVVVDINVYCNNKKIKSNKTTKQLLGYLMDAKWFYTKVYRRCKAIKNSGSKNIDKEIGRWMRLAINHLDDDAIWAFNDVTFSNLMVEILLMKKEPIRIGRKIVG